MRSLKEFCWWFCCLYEGIIFYVFFNLQKGMNVFFDFEDKFLRDFQQVLLCVYNVLWNVGKFFFIIIINMDELLECFFWKIGNGGEKL